MSNPFRMKIVYAMAALCFGGWASAGENADPSDAVAGDLDEIYPVVELLAKAETIVVATIGEGTAMGVPLKIQSTLKRPLGPFALDWGAADPQKKDFDSATYRKAEELLADEAGKKDDKGNQLKPKAPEIPAVPAENVSPEQLEKGSLHVIPLGLMKLPPAGTQALFILWQREKSAKGAPLRYRMAHPQCLYEQSYATTALAALNNRRTAVGMKYLRPWDESMARRLQKKAAEMEIRKLEPGNLEGGLRLKMIDCKCALKRDNSFYAAAKFMNDRNYEQHVYDGLVAEFGVRLRRKGESLDSAIILRAKNDRAISGLDMGVLGIVDSADFVRIQPVGTYMKDLSFLAKDYPALGALEGSYILNVFYTSDQDGRTAEHLGAQAWTGTIVSDDREIVFKGNDVAAKVPGEKVNPEK